MSAAEQQEPTPIRKRRRRKTAEIQPVAVEDSEEQEALPDAAPLTVEIPPAEPQQSSFLDRAKAKLGLTVDKPDVQPKAPSPRLTKGQQEFIEIARPIAGQIGVELGAFAWEKIGGYDYRILAPSDEVAEKIMLPWCRILARTFSLKYKGKITPNQLDAGASLLALAGYSVASLRMFRELKNGERYAAQEEEEANARYRGTAGVVTPRRQAPDDAASRGPLHRPEAGDVSPDGRGVSGPAVDARSADVRNLTDKERYQYQRLAQLSQRDLEVRRRRAGLA